MRFLFGGYTLDAERRELWCVDEAVHVEPQVFDLLLHLVERCGHVVTRDDLIESVWNGRIVSESTLNSRIHAARRAIGDSGERQEFVRTVPRRGVMFVGEVKEAGEDSSAATVAGSAPALPVPTRPSLAVLPFANLSGDSEQEYFADGLVEDIITSLSKMPGFFVIARNSTFTYKGKSVDVRQIAKELGVRYVLEGSVRKADNRVRITGQLVEGSSATHVWADKFEGAYQDIFDLQDRMVASIVGALEPNLRRAEIERALRKRPEALDAYDFYLRALPHIYANSADKNEALRLLEEAVRLDPGYAAPHAFAAWMYEQRYLRSGFNPADREAAFRHAGAVLGTVTDDGQALGIAAWVQGVITDDIGVAIPILDRALEMNPNSVWTLGFCAIASAFQGRHDDAIDKATKALRLSPFDPLNFVPYMALSCAHGFSGRDEEAIRYATLAVHLNPANTFPHFWLVTSLARAGRIEAARSAAKRMQEAGRYTVSDARRLIAMQPQMIEEIVTAFRAAGVPE